jgi:hypothetical protein
MNANIARGLPGLLLTAATFVVTLATSQPAHAGFRTDVPATSSTVGVHCPSEMALVGNSCVDKWEGSLVEIRNDGVEVPFSPYTTPSGRHVRAVSRPNVVPQAHISLVDAQNACKASGKRLCHAAEWKTACKGPDHSQYPYGNSYIENACVDTSRTSPVNVLHDGDHTNYSSMNDPMLNQLPNTLGLTGEAAACTNAYGVHDMVGNIHEWADDGGFHGGYYLDTKINGEGCDYVTVAHSPIYYDYSTGFRCCADADAAPVEAAVAPTTIAPPSFLDVPANSNRAHRAPPTIKHRDATYKVLASASSEPTRG